MRFYEFYQDKEYYYLVTEYFRDIYRLCQGGDLLTKIQIFRLLSERKSAKIIRQIFSAMDFCHKKNIVHRDLKPENILFEDNSVESTAKVTDFGRSKLLTPTQKITEYVGSVRYL